MFPCNLFPERNTTHAIQGDAGLFVVKCRKLSHNLFLLFSRLEEAEHFLNGGAKSDNDGAADDAVADVQFGQARHFMDASDVLIVEAVAGVDFDIELISLRGGGAEPANFSFSGRWIGFEGFGKGAGVEFNGAGFGFGGGGHLGGMGIDEEADLDAEGLQAADGLSKGGKSAGNVKAAFSGQFFAFFGDDADGGGAKLGGDFDHFRRVGHFEVQGDLERLLEPPDVAVLNVPSIFAQMNGDAVATGGFACESGLDGIWLAIDFGAAITGLTNGGDVIDVNAQFEHRQREISAGWRRASFSKRKRIRRRSKGRIRTQASGQRRPVPNQ